MKTGAIPQTPLEAIALAANAIPVPMAETHSGPMLARAIMAATRIGLFDRLAGGPLDLEELATRCGSDVCATAALATALVGAGYLTYRRGCFALTRRSRKWLLASSPSSVRDFILFRYVEWEWMSKLDDYLASGEPIDFHRAMTPQQSPPSASLCASSPCRVAARARCSTSAALTGYTPPRSAAACRRCAWRSWSFLRRFRSHPRSRRRSGWAIASPTAPGMRARSSSAKRRTISS